MLEFLMNLGINMKAALAAAMTIWTLLTAQGYATEDMNDLLDYLSCISYDTEMDEYVVAVEVTKDYTDSEGKLWEVGYVDVLECDSLGECIDAYLDLSKEDLQLLEEYSQWITYREYVELNKAAREG